MDLYKKPTTMDQEPILLDMTNIIREYIQRKKPPSRKLLTKITNPTLAVDLLENDTPNPSINLPPRSMSRPGSKMQSHDTLRIKPKLVKQSRQTRVRISQPSSRVLQPRHKRNSSSQCSNMPQGLKKHFMSMDGSKPPKPKVLKHRYLIEGTIKRGIANTVFKCQDSLKETLVAVKQFSCIEEARELQMMRMFQHRNLMRYQNYFQEDGKFYLTMEHYPTNLLQFITSHNLKENKHIVKEIFRQICLGVDYLHSMDATHLNLKLQHVLIRHERDIKVAIIDFNNAIKLKSSLQKIPKKDYTRHPNYLAPEILTQEEFSPKAVDCWSLGIILYVMLVGRLPFRYNRIQRGKICFPSQTSTDEKLLIKRILNTNPQERFTVKQILQSPWFN